MPRLTIEEYEKGIKAKLDRLKRPLSIRPNLSSILERAKLRRKPKI